MTYSLKRRFTYGLLSAIGISFLVGITNPTVNSNPPHHIAQAQSSDMTLSRLEAILQEEASEVQGSNGQWQITVGDRPLIVLADQTNNRMRIVTPVIAATELEAQQIQNILLANFHTALDARYALSEGTLVSVFVHPLNSLDEDYLRSAIAQVKTLADTFGTAYSSGEIGFGPGESEPNVSPDSLDI